MRTKPTYSNCFLSTAYLIIRGKMKSMIGMRSRSILWPYHLMIRNKSGNIIHFKYLLPHHQNEFAPFWFLGSFDTIGRSVQKDLFTKKPISWEAHSKVFIISVWLIVFAMLIPIWILSWGAYSFLFIMQWLVHGALKRYRRGK